MEAPCDTTVKARIKDTERSAALLWVIALRPDADVPPAAQYTRHDLALLDCTHQDIAGEHKHIMRLLKAGVYHRNT